MNSELSERQEISHETAMFIVAIFLLILYAITGADIVMGAMAMVGYLYIVPVEAARRVWGYVIFADLLFGYWLVGVAAATYAGLVVAGTASLLYTVGSRELRAMWGAERIAINGEAHFGKQIAVLASAGIAWVKALWNGATTGHVVAPEALKVTWQEVRPAGGFQATQTYRAWSWLKDLVTRRQGQPVSA